ncbi:MAG: hypothetical protein NTU63_04130 [Candidatus Pacearchaeota archaeon]|nr:hypothetical protein [Candidatus Pacearchaeota archaeon]
MEKRLVSFALLIVIILLFVSIPFVSAQTYSGFNRFTNNLKLFFSGKNNYSGFNRLTDNIKLFLSRGDNKVRLALEIREKEVNSALENAKKKDTESTIKNLEKAKDKLEIVQEKVSLETSEEVKTSVEEIKDKIKKDGLSAQFNGYVLQEEKTQLAAELTLKTYEYCKALAQEDYNTMLKEEVCNPDTASPGLEKELKELKDIQIKSFVKLMLDIRSCINDPGTCNCEENIDITQKAKCEKMVALALKCEYNKDETSCSELKAMEPKEGDSFAESFVPDFLRNLFINKSDMIDYDIQPSDGVPEECWDENNKPECEQYDYLKETNEDWDEYGNYIGKRSENKEPTMQESIPQCFDENNNFLEEKCGKITVVRNEEGLVNYLIGNEIDNIIENFENASEQHTIDINGTEGRTVVNEMKEEMNVIENQIVERTYAEGTGPSGGEAGVVIKGDKVVNGEGGEAGVVVEGDEQGVKTGGGTDTEEPLPEPDLNQINPDLYDPDARAPGDTVDETYDDATINQGGGEETNIFAP